jgi:antitoxin (DNA-binding transcriptional repressor) of toxin-antitoxin stability system
MPTRTIDESPQILDHLNPGDEILITRDDKPVARVLSPQLTKGIPIYGRGKGKIKIDTEDKSHLKDFAEYMS